MQLGLDLPQFANGPRSLHLRSDSPALPSGAGLFCYRKVRPSMMRKPCRLFVADIAFGFNIFGTSKSVDFAPCVSPREAGGFLPLTPAFLAMLERGHDARSPAFLAI